MFKDTFCLEYALTLTISDKNLAYSTSPMSDFARSLCHNCRFSGRDVTNARRRDMLRHR